MKSPVSIQRCSTFVCALHTCTVRSHERVSSSTNLYVYFCWSISYVVDFTCFIHSFIHSFILIFFTGFFFFLLVAFLHLLVLFNMLFFWECVTAQLLFARCTYTLPPLTPFTLKLIYTEHFIIANCTVDFSLHFLSASVCAIDWCCWFCSCCFHFLNFVFTSFFVRHFSSFGCCSLPHSPPSFHFIHLFVFLLISALNFRALCLAFHVSLFHFC